jgi:ATP-binding cassette subfamily F protein 3
MARLPRETEQQVRGRLARFGLDAARAGTKAAHLSGGEKARLALCLMCLDAPQFLILDEPTNHLDIDSREALVEALNDFPGAVVLISHDRHLVELVADRLWLVAGGRVQPYEGDLDDYRRLLLETDAGGGGPGRPAGSAPSRAERRSAGQRRSLVAPLREAARRAEQELARLSAELAAVEARLADPATYALGGNDPAILRRRLGELTGLVAAAEARWLEAESEIEQLQAS